MEGWGDQVEAPEPLRKEQRVLDPLAHPEVSERTSPWPFVSVLTSSLGRRDWGLRADTTGVLQMLEKGVKGAPGKGGRGGTGMAAPSHWSPQPIRQGQAESTMSLKHRLGLLTPSRLSRTQPLRSSVWDGISHRTAQLQTGMMSTCQGPGPGSVQPKYREKD